VIYVALGDADLQIERVRLRAALGGHDIPDVDIRRRYFRSLSRVRKRFAWPTRLSCSTTPDLCPRVWLCCEKAGSFGSRVHCRSGCVNCWIESSDPTARFLPFVKVYEKRTP
jgi:predicted ABC-type ATPase